MSKIYEEIKELCIGGWQDAPHHKTWYFEEILKLLYSKVIVEEIKEINELPDTCAP